MGKGSRRKARADQYDSSDAESMSSVSTAFSDLTMANETEHVNSLDFQLEKHIDALYEKRGSERERALLGLAEAFEGQVLLPFIENNKGHHGARSSASMRSRKMVYCMLLYRALQEALSMSLTFDL